MKNSTMFILFILLFSFSYSTPGSDCVIPTDCGSGEMCIEGKCIEIEESPSPPGFHEDEEGTETEEPDGEIEEPTSSLEEGTDAEKPDGEIEESTDEPMPLDAGEEITEDNQPEEPEESTSPNEEGVQLEDHVSEENEKPKDEPEPLDTGKEPDLPIEEKDTTYLGLVKDYLLPAIILIVIMMLSLTWLASDLFQNPQLKAWVKNELKELIVAFLVFVIVSSLFLSTNSFVELFTGEPDYQTFAINKLYGFRQQLITPLSESLVPASHYLGMMTGYTYSFPIPAFFVSFSFTSSPHSGASSLPAMISQATNALTNGIFLYTGLIVLLKFLIYAVQYILPIALALRFIPFTRKTGATLIALCIGAAIIFPTSIIFASLIHDSIDASVPSLDMSPIEFEIPVNISDYCSASDAMERWGEAITTLNIGELFHPRNAIPFGLAFLKIGEMVYALIKCSLCCVADPFTFVACYFAESMVIYNLIATLYEIIAIATFVIPNITANVTGIDVIEIYEALIPVLEGINNLMVLSIIDSLFIGIITIVGTKSISGAFGGQHYLPLVERFLK